MSDAGDCFCTSKIIQFIEAVSISPLSGTATFPFERRVATMLYMKIDGWKNGHYPIGPHDGMSVCHIHPCHDHGAHVGAQLALEPLLHWLGPLAIGRGVALVG